MPHLRLILKVSKLSFASRMNEIYFILHAHLLRVVLHVLHWSEEKKNETRLHGVPSINATETDKSWG